MMARLAPHQQAEPTVVRQHGACGREAVCHLVCRIGYPSLSYGQLQRLMARVGWSDAELARRLSVRPGTVRNWRTGRREVPPNLLDWLHMYAEAIDRLPPLPKDWTRG